MMIKMLGFGDNFQCFSLKSHVGEAVLIYNVLFYGHLTVISLSGLLCKSFRSTEMFTHSMNSS